MVHDRGRYRLLFFPKGGDKIYCWQYAVSGSEQITGDGSGVDPQDLRVGQWTTLRLPNGVDALDAEVVERTADLPEVWVAGSDGRVYYLQDDAQVDYANDGSTSPVSSFIEWHALPLGPGPLGRGEPRYLELQTNSQTGGTVTCTITLSDGIEGPTLVSNTFNITIGSAIRSIIVPIPPTGRHAAWCRVKLARGATSNEDFGIRKARLYYIPRTAFKGGE
jgi:hypothetical protein